ncbi:MAG: DUF4097 family beta strand repeat protein [Solobacterium sp.]|nr:DUF4097 family beta strand repeat protein [Solobacterium sp.]
MTRDEYLHELRERLVDYPKDIQEDVLNSFISHFSQAKRAGKTDEEIIADLGTIDVVIDGIEQLILEGKTFGKKKTTNESNEFLNSVGKDIEQIGSAVGSIAKEFFKVAKKTIKTIDIHTDDERNMKEGTLSNIEGCDSLEILTSASQADIVIIGGTEFVWRFYPKKGLISQSEALFKTDVERNLIKVMIGSKGGTSSSGRLEVIIPSSIKNIKIDQKVGDIQINNLVLDELSTTNLSGDIELRSLVSKKTAIYITNGDLVIDDVEGDVLSIVDQNGDVEINHHHGGMIHCNLKNGDAKIVTDAEAPRIIVNNVNGDIECVSLKENYVAEVKIQSGDCTSKLNKPVYKVEKGRWIAGEGDGIIQLVTKSGDVTLG